MKKIGVIGGGQLAWMMAMAAPSLGVKLIVQTPNLDDPAVALADDKIFAKIDDVAATADLAQRCDVITFENEFVDLIKLQKLADQGVCFYPSLSTLSSLLDKYHQLDNFRALGLPTPHFSLVNSDLLPVSDFPFSFPLVVKARRHGYDGQGTFIIKDQLTFQSVCQKLGYQSVLLQEFIPFERELAVVAARAVNGEIEVYPIVETVQVNQVCLLASAPAEISTELAQQIKSIASIILTSLNVVGVFGIELFLTKNGQVLINEIAPRTHNSGHFTINACETSQFAQHLRAISGLPLGSTALKCHSAVMVNLLGYESAMNDYQVAREKLANLPNASVYWYGKSVSRPGRKMGHVTVLSESDTGLSCREWANMISQQVENIWHNR